MKTGKRSLLLATAIISGAGLIISFAVADVAKLTYGRFHVKVKMYSAMNRPEGRPWPADTVSWHVPDIYYLNEYCLETSIHHKGVTHQTLGTSEITRKEWQDSVYILINTLTGRCASFDKFSKDVAPQHKFSLTEKSEGLISIWSNPKLKRVGKRLLNDSMIDGHSYRRELHVGETAYEGYPVERRIVYYWNDRLTGLPNLMESVSLQQSSRTLMQGYTEEYYWSDQLHKGMKDSNVIWLDPRPGEMSKEKLVAFRQMIEKSGI